jgi:hypothetical protein
MPQEPPTDLSPADETPETIEVLSQLFQEWKRAHPDGTWRAFWAAVAAGEVQIPTA